MRIGLRHGMGENPEHALAEDQFGFREGRSTCDALLAVKEKVKTEADSGGVTIATSLDIRNAFNSVPWNRIREAMETKKFPLYIRQIVGSYLDCRCIEFPKNGGGRESRPVLTGMPQGSVLGPLLWNIAYDGILQGVERGCRIICG